MDARWPWLLLAVPVVLVLLLAWWSRPPRRRTGGGAEAGDDLILVAHASRVRALPRFRALVRRQTLLTGYRSVAVLVVCAGALVVAARPQSTEVLQPDSASRDVMLCLDASGSMSEYNVEVVEQMRAIASYLEGERIGLTIFSGSAVRVFPLTDDHEFVLDQLDDAERAFATNDYEYTAGTDASNGLSLLSDGLVTCAQGFDRTEEERGRAIIVSSDNDPIGKPVFTMPEAGEYAARREIVVHAVASPLTGEGGPREEFEETATSTGGTFSVLDEDGSSQEIVRRIEQLEERRVEEPPQTLVREEPRVGTVVAGVGLALLVLGWVAEVVLTRRRRT